MHHLAMNHHLFNQLSYLLITADGVVCEKETELWKKISITHGFDDDFQKYFDQFESKDKAEILLESVQSLKQIPKNEQINLIAYLCVVANADGFMDSREWKLIYTLYHRELKLAQKDILDKQRILIDKILSLE
jgi:uncharacterized tellurite resistance protein B-like protein